MFDLWAPEHSVLREKVIERAFLAELSRSLLLDLAMPFEVLRSEFDAFGYDVVIEANRVLRHIQLKATVASGSRAHVDVQLALADKPGGCVVWVFVDRETLRLGPFLWYGGEPGQPLPLLGDRAVRHMPVSSGPAVGSIPDCICDINAFARFRASLSPILSTRSIFARTVRTWRPFRRTSPWQAYDLVVLWQMTISPLTW